MSELTQAILKSLLTYDPETGVFTWRVSRGTRCAGSLAGANSQGYIRIKLSGVQYMAHRLAWLYVNGNLPTLEIDHINRLRNDNRIENLRLATHSQNTRNANIRTDNKTGVRGVSWHKQSRSWYAYVHNGHKRVGLGYHKTFGAAVAARTEAEERYGYAAANI
jgi:hypothetical protein